MGAEAEVVWLSFSQLSPRRDSDQGTPKPISIQAIWCYIDLVLTNITEDEVEDLLYFLQILDDKYLADQKKRLEKSQKKTGSKRGRRGRR